MSGFSVHRRRLPLLVTLIFLMSTAAAGGRKDATSMVGALAEEYWKTYLEEHPVAATFLGFRDHDARLPDVTPAGRRAHRRGLERLQSRVDAIDVDRLDEEARITWMTLAGEIQGELDWLACGLEAWTLDPLEGPQVMLQHIAALQTVETPAQGRDLVRRYRAVGPYLDASVANLRTSLEEGLVAARAPAERVARQLDALLAQPTEDWTLLDPTEAEHQGWEAEELGRFRADLAAAVREVIRPGLAGYAEVVNRTILPSARPQELVGLAFIPDGEACYRRLVRHHTSLDLTPSEIHEFGLSEIARIRAELQELGERALGTGEHSEILDRLRGDQALFFASRDDVEAVAVASLDRARQALGQVLGRLPAAPCTVRRVEPFEEIDTTIAYYREPAADGSRPGIYYVNTYAPETRPRYEAEALAFHESIPGHHVQIAVAQEQAGLPEFRRYLGSTALVEGWALYTERLAQEMGLYSGDLDRIGMLSFDAWRASRLVVDTGLHALGWSRERAVEYMKANTALAENNILNEVDRYIVWPGQALAYKIGQREILRLRSEAETRLGDAFDLKAFHDRVLHQGAVGLPVLRRWVTAWIEKSAAPEE